MNWTVSTVPPVSRQSTGNITMKLWRGCVPLLQVVRVVQPAVWSAPILPGVEACGKTGTAQNRGKDHSVFMGFAPMNDPKIAIAVYVENGGFGATYGVPIGAMMMDQYLHGKLSPENEIRAEEFSNRVILYGDEER